MDTPQKSDENTIACEAVVSKNIRVGAQVTVTPSVLVGKVESECLESRIFGRQDDGSLCVCQTVRLRIPLRFSAEAAAKPTDVRCEAAETGGRANSIWYYKSHAERTNALIASAGGTIVLGRKDSGASLTVTAENADLVLSFRTPSPPAPEASPFAQHFRVLYAQLLAANLNLLAGTANDGMLSAVDAANEFLAGTKAGRGRRGALWVAAPLAQFNEGKAGRRRGEPGGRVDHMMK